MAHLGDVTVVIPVAPGEQAWKPLLEDLSLLPLDTEVIFASETLPKEAPRLLAALSAGRKIRWTTSPRKTRAEQMNAGAKLATRNYLWFLHADCRFGDETLDALEEALKPEPKALLYFKLRYLDGAPLIARLNEIGAALRARALSRPSGKQGYCLMKSLFDEAQGFSALALREDFEFVQRSKIKTQGIAVPLFTSPRSFIERGWWCASFGG